MQALILACGLLMCGLAAVKIFELWGEWRWLPSSLWGGGWLAVPAVMLALLAVMGGTVSGLACRRETYLPARNSSGCFAPSVSRCSLP